MLVELFFFRIADAWGLIRRHDGLGEAIGVNTTTIFEAWGNGGEAANNYQDDSEGRPDQGDLANGSHVLGPTKQQT